MENGQSVSRGRYSQLELGMFDSLGVAHIALSRLTAPEVYRLAGEKAFIEGLQGPAVDSLRRCISEIYHGHFMRLTPEWDAMIRLDDDSEQDDDPTGKERCKTLAEISGLTVTCSKQTSGRYFVFKVGSRDVKTVYTYRKAKTFAQGVACGRSAGIRELAARYNVLDPNYPAPGQL